MLQRTTTTNPLNSLDQESVQSGAGRSSLRNLALILTSSTALVAGSGAGKVEAGQSAWAGLEKTAALTMPALAHNAGFEVTVNGKTYTVERTLAVVQIAPHSRNGNFRLDVSAGEKVIFVAERSGSSEAEVNKLQFRLKRDKQGKFGAKDVNVKSPLFNGDVWKAGDYKNNGPRFYVKFEDSSSTPVKGHFYVVK